MAGQGRPRASHHCHVTKPSCAARRSGCAMPLGPLCAAQNRRRRAMQVMPLLFRAASMQGPSGPLLAAGGGRPGIYAGLAEAASPSVPLVRLAVIPVYGDPGLWMAAAGRPMNGPDRANQHQSNPFSDHQTRHECRAYYRLKPKTGVNARPRHKIVPQPQPYWGTIASISRKLGPPYIYAAAVFFLLLLTSSISYADEAMMVRVAWGGGSERLWEGAIAVSRGIISQPRPLGIEADEPGSMWLEDGRLLIRQRSPRTYDGVDLIVTAPADAKLIVQLTPGERFAAPSCRCRSKFPWPTSPASSATCHSTTARIDCWSRRAPGDPLLVRMSHPSMVFAPGEAMHFEVLPHLLPVRRRHPRADPGPVARRPAAAIVVQRTGDARRQRASHSDGTDPATG